MDKETVGMKFIKDIRHCMEAYMPITAEKPEDC